MSYSIGVDIVEWEKAKTFYETHRARLGTFLSTTEKRFVEDGRAPYRALAMIFASKEAVFKTLGLPWMGPEGFRRIKIRPVSYQAFISSAPDGRKLHITFKKSKRHVVACCAIS